MSQRFQRLLSELRDSGKYVRIRDVSVFDEHSETYYVDGDGRPCLKGDPGAKKVVRKFGRKELEQIAARCNARDQKGSLSPLTFGHTKPAVENADGSTEPADERKQPKPRGYAATWKVVFDPEEKKHLLKTDFHISRSEYPEAKTYPRVSVELWPKQGVIDPIALLRRTPQRDLGQWTYAAASGEAVLRYSMESKMAEDTDLSDLPDGPAEETPEPAGHEEPAAPAAPAEEDTDEMAHDRLMRDHVGHKDYARGMAHMCAKYGMGDAGGGGTAGDAPPGGEPNMSEPAPPEAPIGDEPDAYAAFAAPSATNAVMAPAAKGKAKPFAQAGSALQYQRERDAAVKDLNKTKAELYVTRLLADDISVDAELEVPVFEKLTEPQRHARDQYIRKHHSRVPTGGRRLAAAGGKQAAVPDLEEDPESIPQADLNAVLAYQRKHSHEGAYDLPLHEAAARALPNKYAKHGQPKKGA